MEVDLLAVISGDDFVVNENITVHQPSLREIKEFGEKRFFNMIYTICAIPSDVKSLLWDQMNHTDWTTVEDFQLFMMLSQTMTPDKTGIIFGDLDFSKMRPYPNKVTGEIVLADKEAGIIIDQLIYMRIMNYLRKLHNITPKPEKAKGKRAKEAMIDEDRRNREFNKDKPFKSFLLPLISAVKVRQGYTKDYIKNMGLFEFFDDLTRLQIINQSDHLLNGAYSGMCDLSKVPKEQFNWLREQL